MKTIVTALALAALAAVALSAVAAPASAAGPRDRSCAWILEPTADRENILFPELTTRYLGAVIPVPPGGHIEITGEFPHARYFSLQTYSHTLQSVTVLRDEQIRPDAGSRNPYLRGGDRSAERRRYTVKLKAGSPPNGKHEPNTLYDTNVEGSRTGFGLAMRTYLPDRGTGPFGGVAAPDITIVLADGTAIPLPVCPDPLIDIGLTQLLAGAGVGDLSLPEGPGLLAHREAVWRKYVNAPTGYADILTDNDVLGGLEESLAALTTLLPSGLGENADNKYVSTQLSREFGSVAVITGRMPTTPKTFDGQPRMTGGQMRFWSMCSGNVTTQGIGCLVDEEVRLDPKREFAIAVSTSAGKPANAGPGCRVGWIPWGPDPRAILIMRNMLPASSFAHSVQKAERGTEKATLGPYYPKVRYLADRQAFDRAFAC